MLLVIHRFPNTLVQARFEQMIRAASELTHLLGATPTTSDIAHYLDMDPGRVHEAQNAHLAFAAASLDALLEEQPGSLPHLMRHMMHADAQDRLDLAIAEMRFMQDMTQHAIGEHLGISQMFVSRLLAALVAP